jgi:putative ABC transport system ATP-binding protein
MAQNETLIEIEDLTKVFYTDEVETHALSGIHLTVSRGEYVAMSGPSGCGKSTLLSILGLLDTPTGGRYLLNGNPVENLSFADRSRIRNQEIGFIFQSFNPSKRMSSYPSLIAPECPRPSASGASKRPWNV